MDKGKGIAMEEIEKRIVETTNLPDWLTPLTAMAVEFHS